MASNNTNMTVPIGALPVEKATPAQGLSVEITSFVFLGFAWLVVLLRFWTRLFVVRAVGWDDWIMGLSTIFFTVFSTGCIVCAFAATGSGYFMVVDVDTAIDWMLVAEVFYVLTMMTLKISLAIFFLRIMVRPWQRRTIYLAVGFATLFNIGYFFFAIFQCGYPSSALVVINKRIANKCVTRSQILGLSYTHGAITSLTDIVFAFLPIAMLRSLKMNRREKVTVGLILLLAAVGGIASMVRMKYIARLASTSLTFFTDVNVIAIWSTIEPGLGIIAGSLATLRPLVRTWYDTARSYGPSRITRHARSKSGNTLVELSPRNGSPVIHDDTFYRSDVISKEPVTGQNQIQKSPWRPGGRSSRHSTPVFNRQVDYENLELQHEARYDSTDELANETYKRFPQPPQAHALSGA